MKRETNSPERRYRLGLRCPDCGCRYLPVRYQRQQLGQVMRVRHCRNCGRRVVTRERMRRMHAMQRSGYRSVRF